MIVTLNAAVTQLPQMHKHSVILCSEQLPTTQPLNGTPPDQQTELTTRLITGLVLV